VAALDVLAPQPRLFAASGTGRTYWMVSAAANKSTDYFSPSAESRNARAPSLLEFELKPECPQSPEIKLAITGTQAISPLLALLWQ
jgi:hypothetical protein